MEYLKRSLERKFTQMNSFFKAILVTGARQVGKTTMLRHLGAGQSRTYVTLDNIVARDLAKSDPVLFFQMYKPPVIIDDVQYAPELFGQIKIICDGSEETGLFWLTGSQQFAMMKNVNETLAGRIGILEMYSFSKNEKEGVFFEDDFDFSLSCLQKRQSRTAKNDIVSVFEHIWRGGMPQLTDAGAEELQEYFRAYVNTYLIGDAMELGGITDSLRFGKFLAGCATLTANQVNYKTLAEIAEVSQPTAKEWLHLLKGMGVVYLLQPYFNNALKRLTKTPKLYFCDTGLAAHLSMWLTRETLMNGAAGGHFFENFVVTEMLRSFAYGPRTANMFYYRDSNAKEIDLIVERDGLIHPFGIKKSANPDKREVKKFDVLSKASLGQGNGGIICMCEEPMPIDSKNCFVPCNLI